MYVVRRVEESTTGSPSGHRRHASHRDGALHHRRIGSNGHGTVRGDRCERAPVLCIPERGYEVGICHRGIWLGVHAHRNHVMQPLWAAADLLPNGKGWTFVSKHKDAQTLQPKGAG